MISTAVPIALRIIGGIRGKSVCFAPPRPRLTAAAQSREQKSSGQNNVGSGRKGERSSSHSEFTMSSKPASVRGYLEIPEQLNLATYVIERHVEEGRGARVAAWAEGRAYTFADLRAL